MFESSADYRVLIIGAGPAGMIMAQALKRHGIRSTVYEKDSALDARPRDWNFGIYWAQSPLRDCLSDELCEKVIREAQIDNRPMSADDVMPIYNGQTGDLLKEVPAPNSLRIHRRNFLRTIGRDLDIQYGKKLKYIESDGTFATAHFEDGHSDRGNLIIGAEGAHSKVREFLVGEEKAKLENAGIVASATMAKLPSNAAIAFQKLHPRYHITFHPEGIFTWIGVHDAFSNTKPGDWTFMIIQSWHPKDFKSYDPTALKDSAKILTDMKERASIYAEPFRTLLESIPEGTQCWHNELSYWIPQPWDNRNSTVTLVGDAAHPMTFHRGQGLNNAIHDVATLAKLLSEKGTAVPSDNNKSAVSEYESEMLQRGKDAVIGSRENTVMIHDWKTLLKSPLFSSGLSKPEAKQAVSNITEVAT